MKTFNSIIVVATIALLSASLSECRPDLFEFCDGRDSGAPCYQQHVSEECLDIREDFDDKISSLSSFEERTVCIQMFEDKACQGRSVYMVLQYPVGQKDNMPKYFDNVTSSVRLCPAN